MKNQTSKKQFFFLALMISIMFSACTQSESAGQVKMTESQTLTFTPVWTETLVLSETPTKSRTPTSTNTLTQTQTYTITLTPVNTETPTISPSPTFDFPEVEVNVAAAHCRYGPSKAFMHAADLYEGDHGEVRGRFLYSDWLFVKFDKLNYYCWVSPYVIDVTGDISNINYKEYDLQSVGSFDLYEPTQHVQATRKGDEVTITWGQVHMTEDDDRGYLIVAWVCQNGLYLWWTKSFEDQFTTSYTVIDDGSCIFPSSGVIYTVEKHGFSKPVTIPWP